MTIQQVIDKILAYHPTLDRPQTCDGFKSGDPTAECTGIVTTCAASVEVIREAARLGCNLIIAHEPTFYTHMDQNDWLEGDPVYEGKLALLNQYGIAVWRDHDHIHAHRPDGIFQGVMKELGWEQYLVDDPGRPRMFRLPKTTARVLAAEVKEKIGLKTLRVIGNLDAEVETVSFFGHIYPPVPEHEGTEKMREVDVLIPGEIIDWTTASYARDAGQLGMNKVIFSVGHFNMEELGMKYAVSWLRELAGPELPIHFVQSGDMYQYL